jgi:hypothetical protein
VSPPPRAPRRLLLARVNGKDYYDAATAFTFLRVGDAVALRREPANRHDRRAIAVDDGEGRKPGYVARTDNSAVACMMNAGERFEARGSAACRGRWTYAWRCSGFRDGQPWRSAALRRQRVSRIGARFERFGESIACLWWAKRHCFGGRPEHLGLHLCYLVTFVSFRDTESVAGGRFPAVRTAKP